MKVQNAELTSPRRRDGTAGDGEVYRRGEHCSSEYVIPKSQAFIEDYDIA